MIPNRTPDRPRTVAALASAVALALLVSLAATPAAGANDTATAPPDPDEDVLGWENGYWHNESIDVNQSDGLSPAEREAFVARSMARVEYLRRLEFVGNVSLETVSRAELRERLRAQNTTFGASTTEQLWEALFLVGEDTDAATAIREYQASVALGFAAEEGADRVVIVTATPDRPVVGGVTLIHELAHMLQHQQFDLHQSKYYPDVHDRELAKDGLVEGEATYVHYRYQQRCGVEWECVDAPSGWSGTQPADGPGLSRLFYQPYSDGPVYVDRLLDRGGWDAVADAHAELPTASERIIHPGRSDDPPEPVSVRDTARNGWRVIRGPGPDYEVVGEASIYALFWSEARAHDLPGIERTLGGPLDGPLDTYNYTSAPSAGWGNDTLVAYRNDSHRGYVWKTVWDSDRDAREFFRAYRSVLSANGAVARANHTWMIEDGPYADAFRVVREGDTVTVVNAPTVAALDDVRPRNSDGESDAVTAAARPWGVATVAAALGAVLAIAYWTRTRA